MPGFVQLVGESREALLRAVVEVALDPPALGVRRVDEPGARCPQPRRECSRSETTTARHSVDSAATPMKSCAIKTLRVIEWK